MRAGFVHARISNNTLFWSTCRYIYFRKVRYFWSAESNGLMISRMHCDALFDIKVAKHDDDDVHEYPFIMCLHKNKKTYWFCFLLLSFFRKKDKKKKINRSFYSCVNTLWMEICVHHHQNVLWNHESLLSINNKNRIWLIIRNSLLKRIKYSEQNKCVTCAI